MIKVQRLINNNPKDKTVIEARKIPDANNISIEENHKHCKILIVNKDSIKKSEPGRGQYTVEIEMDTPNLELTSNVKVMCTCQNFNFQWAYVLHSEDALLRPERFDYAIKNKPKITNPGEIRGCCKHIQFSINEILSHRIKNLSPNIGEL